MARAVSSDHLQSMNFQVQMVPGVTGSVRNMGRPGDTQAGFATCTTPSASTDAVEYREGTYRYTRKYPGIPSMEDISLTRGITRQDTAFFDWARQAWEGQGEFREDLDILHFHRDNAYNPDLPANPRATVRTQIDTTGAPAMRYQVREGFPIRGKPAGDLDGTSPEISLAELDISYEYFDVVPGAVPG